MNKIVQLAIVSLLVVSAFFAGLGVAEWNGHRNPKVSVNVFISETSGGVVSELEAGNVITDIGEIFVRNTLCADNESNAVVKYISLSNDASPVVTWTKLPNEVDANGFSRATGTVVGWASGGDSCWNVTYQFTASGGQQLQCAGLNWVVTGASDNNLFACAAFTQTTFAASDTLTITWVVTVDAN